MMKSKGVGLMKERVSRRSVLKTGAMGVAPLVAGAGAMTPTPARAQEAPQAGRPGRQALNENPALHRIRSGRLIVDFDHDLGTIHAITAGGDSLGTNFLGNQLNTRGVALGDAHWTGDFVAMTYRQSDRGDRRSRWNRESTLDSDDTRTVEVDARGLRVRYETPSENEDGIRSFALAMSYRLDGGDSMVWDLEITNTSGRELEIGDVTIPLRANDDYASVHRQELPEAETIGRMTAIQKVIHEQKVLAHSFVAGHSSYVLMQRPNGDGPFLLVRCENNTSFECQYKVPGTFAGDWIGTDLFAVHSWATHQIEGWGWNPWVNNHSSLVLQPGERRAYRLRFALIDDYSAIRESLVSSGNLGIRIVPGMVVRENTDVLVEIKSLADLDDIEIHADGVQIKERRRVDDATLLTLSFAGRGQKSLKLLYGGGRWTNVHFFCVEDAERLLKARASFMARRQFYENPDDPFNRHHVFLPFDFRQAKMIDYLDDCWEVGGTGDPGFGEPLFLAEKNVHYPSREEIDKLEAYVDDCLFRHIQNPETFEVRAGLFWVETYPSSRGGHYSKERSEQTERTYNYCFAANIYHSMYRIGKRYDVLSRRTATQYLRLAYETCRKWFTTGPFMYAGLITGSNAVEILADIEREGWTEEHATMLQLMRTCQDEFIRDPFPYSSEIEIDETGQHQVYFFTRMFAGQGDARSRAKYPGVVRVLKALRGGDQPIWFAYGNDLFAHPDFRGQLSCWHSEALNGLCLLTHFDDTGDTEALMKGYPGVLSVLRNVYPDGMGYGWFMFAPGVFGHEPERTFESGPGLWGYLRAVKSYVVEDPAFGLVGYGCRVETAGDQIRAIPLEGVKKRVRWVAEQIDVEAMTGEISEASLSRADRSLSLRMADSTGLVDNVQLRIGGLAPGSYEITHGGVTDRREVEDILHVEVPIDQASVIAIRPA